MPTPRRATKGDAHGPATPGGRVPRGTDSPRRAPASRAGVATYESALRVQIDPFLVLEAIRDGAGTVADFRIADANQAALDANHTRREDYVGRRVSQVSPGFLTGPLAPHWRTALESGEALVLDDFEYAFPATGERRRYDIRGCAVGDSLSYSWRDVTERHDLLERYRLLAENASDVVYRASTDLVLEWVSPSVTQLLGWDPADLVGRSLVELAHPDDLGPIAEAIEKNPPGTPATSEVRARTAEGGWRWVSIFGRGIVGEDGQAMYYVGGARDAQAEHDQREALAASESRYRLLAENASDVVASADDHGTLTWVSDSVSELLGWRADELVGRNVAELVHSDDLSGVREFMSRVPSGNVERHRARMATADGGYRWVSSRVRQLIDDATGSPYRVAAWSDVQSEVVAELATQESEDRYRTLAENASDVVLLIDDDFVIRWASPSVTAVLGWNPADVVGHPREEFMTPGDSSRIAEARERGDESTLEIQVRRADGTTIWMASRSTPILEPRSDFGGRVVALRDIDAAVRARDDLAASESRFRLLAENATDVVYQIDNNDVILWASPSFERVLGWSAASAVGQRSTRFIHPEDVATVHDFRDAVLRGEARPDAEVRYVGADGRPRWMAREVHPIRDRLGRVTAQVVGLRAIDAEVTARESLRQSEERYRLLAEHASDVIFQTDGDGVVVWVSPSVEQVLGFTAREVVGRELLEVVFEDDRERARAWRSLAHLGNKMAAHEYRYRSASGDARWMSVISEPVTGEGGGLRAVVVALRDCQAEILTRRALTTLSEGSRALARAEVEGDLLRQMCQIAVDEAGYAFAWYGRKVDDPARTVAKVAAARVHREYIDDVVVSWADVPEGRGPTGRAIRLGSTVVSSDFRTDPAFGLWRASAEAHGFRSSIAVAVRVGDDVDGALTVYAPEAAAFDERAVAMFEDLAGELGVGLGRLRDRERLVRALDDQALLTSAIEQSGEAIVLTDPYSTITYANPAATRISGYSREELVGANPRVLQSGLHPREFYLEMWSTLLGGQSWRGVLVNRHKSGSLFEEEATISPIHNAEGTLVAYVAVKHDLTAVRRLEATIDAARSDHGTIVMAMRDIQPGDSLEESASAFCEAATRLSGIDAASVLLLEDDNTLLPIAVRGSGVLDLAKPSPIRLTGLNPAIDLVGGPVQVSLEPGEWPANDDLLDAVVADGLLALALAPIRWRGEVVGVLALATRSRDAAARISERFAFYEELGSYAGTLLGAQVRTLEHREAIRVEVRRVIDRRQFHTVFQPVVDLLDGRVVGYEALTRFDDDTPPADRIAQAHSVGLGTELEAACASVALEAASTLDPALTLSVNFSPAALLDGSAGRTLCGAGRGVIVEVTEHAPIENFASVRAAVAAIPNAQLSVDDAGAGFASLHHVLELRPAYVKLDISIVRDIDSDTVRQAMAAGLCHFARLGDVTIVAEGIETEGEADTLRGLGVAMGSGRILGQGFFFGRGGPIPLAGDPLAASGVPA